MATANSMRLSQINSEYRKYEAQDEAGVDHKNHPITHQRMDTLLEKLVPLKTLELKVGAQVMLIKVFYNRSLIETHSQVTISI